MTTRPISPEQHMPTPPTGVQEPHFEAPTPPLEFPVGYFDAQVRFAGKWSDITGEDLGETLLHKTALYRRVCNEKPPTDGEDAAATWEQLMSTIDPEAPATSITEALYDVYRAQPHSAYDPEAHHGLGYDYYPKTATVKIHFSNPVRGENPFSEENMPGLRNDFQKMLMDVWARHPDAQRLVSNTWLRSTKSYQSLSPPDRAPEENVMSPDMGFGGNSVWGQFMDRFGQTNERVYAQFTAALEAAETVDDLLAAFPFPVMKADDPIEAYYRYYKLQDLTAL